MSLKTVLITSTKQRAALLAAALFCVLAALFIVKWSIANTSSTRNLYPEVADLSISLAPNDPQTHFARAAIYEKSLFVEDAKYAVREYEIATSLSPNDFRFWYSLGLARERAGDGSGAELALKKSLELAPHYSQQLWAYGNVLLRQGKSDIAFDFIRAAAESDISFAAPAVVAAAQEFPDDPQIISSKLGNSPNANAAAAIFFTKSGKFGEARNFWTMLSPEARNSTFRETGETLLALLIGAKSFRFAAEVAKDIGKTGDESVGLGIISNSGFEDDIANSNATIFSWTIGDGLQPQIGFDEKIKHGGNRSLGIVYDSPNGLDFRSLRQTVTVESNVRYAFSVFARADVKSESSLKWEVLDASSGAVLCATPPVPSATDWMELSCNFETSPTLEAVNLHIVRVPCSSAACPTRGKIWFDDLSILRTQ